MGQVSSTVSGNVGVSVGVAGVSMYVGAEPGMPGGMDATPVSVRASRPSPEAGGVLCMGGPVGAVPPRVCGR